MESRRSPTTATRSTSTKATRSPATQPARARRGSARPGTRSPRREPKSPASHLAAAHRTTAAAVATSRAAHPSRSTAAAQAAVAAAHTRSARFCTRASEVIDPALRRDAMRLHQRDRNLRCLEARSRLRAARGVAGDEPSSGSHRRSGPAMTTTIEHQAALARIEEMRRYADVRRRYRGTKRRRHSRRRPRATPATVACRLRLWTDGPAS